MPGTVLKLGKFLPGVQTLSIYSIRPLMYPEVLALLHRSCGQVQLLS